MQIDFTPNSNDVSKAISEAVDKAMERDMHGQEPRKYLGGSRLGEPCERKLGFEFHHYPSEKPFTGQTLRRFRRGHDAESRMIGYLRSAGFDLRTEKSDGKQFGFYVARDADGEARIAGHLDGIFIAGPADLSGFERASDLARIRYPALWEHKGLNNKGIGDLGRVGLARAYPVYYAQMQTYMAYLNLVDNPGLFTAENQDDCTFYAELVPFNLKAAQEASDRGSRVVSAGDPFTLPRITRDPQDYRCTVMCGHYEKCWNGPQYGVPVAPVQAAAPQQSASPFAPQAHAAPMASPA